jgi:hypothetical protein
MAANNNTTIYELARTGKKDAVQNLIQATPALLSAVDQDQRSTNNRREHARSDRP